MKIAIHTVFILKENILFLEEWIKYHILLGFNKFYLYDNSKINKISGFDKKHINTIKFGNVNKYKVDYGKIVNMTNEQMNIYMKNLCDKYKCIELIEWSPTDKKGNILYNQREAHNNCLKILKKDKVEWCANIDMDEYIAIKNFDSIEKYLLSLPQNVKNIRLGQVRFDSRFNNLDKLVTDINKAEIKKLSRFHSNKNIYNVKKTKELNIHIATLEEGKTYSPPVDEIWFNHYKLNNKKYKCIRNLNTNIKSTLKEETFLDLIIKKGIFHIGIWRGNKVENYYEQGFTDAFLFDANPEVLKICNDKVKKLNNNNYKCIEYAISDKDDEVIDFYILKSNHGSSSILPPSDVWKPGTERYERTKGLQKVIKVKTKRMDTFINENNIDISIFKTLIITVQGCEMMVLKGLSNYINNFDTILIQVTKDNWHEAQYIGGCWFSEVNEYLTKRGFKLNSPEYYNDAWFHGNVEYIKN